MGVQSLGSAPAEILKELQGVSVFSVRSLTDEQLNGLRKTSQENSLKTRKGGEPQK